MQSKSPSVKKIRRNKAFTMQSHTKKEETGREKTKLKHTKILEK